CERGVGSRRPHLGCEWAAFVEARRGVPARWHQDTSPVRYPFPSTKAPSRRRMWAIRERIGGQSGVWAYPHPWTQEGGDRRREGCGWARGGARRAPATAAPRSDSYANSALWYSAGGRRVCERIFLDTLIDS